MSSSESPAVQSENASAPRATHAGAPHANAPHAIAPQESALAPWLLRAVDAGLFALIFFAPYFMGGRHPLGELVVIALSVWVGAAWILRQTVLSSAPFRRSWADWLILAAILLVVIQITPLPTGWLHALSPHATSILPLWNGSAGAASDLGTWSTVSLYPAATRAGLVLLLAYATLFCVTRCRIQSLRDVERLLTWIALSAVAMALFGMAQYVAGNGKFCWIYEHPFRDTLWSVKGTFINRNHFAHMLALGAGPLAWWIFQAASNKQNRSGRRRHETGFSAAPRRAGDNQKTVTVALRGVAAVIVVFAVLVSLSRGGAAVLLLSLCVSLAVLYRRRWLSAKAAAGICGAGMLVVAALTIHGYRQVSGRLDDFTSGSIEQLDTGGGRRGIWTATIAAAADFPILGTGVGTFREVYPAYYEQPSQQEFTHAESGYLQVLLETGIGGLGMLLAGLGCCAYWCISGLRRAETSPLAVPLAAVAGSLLVSAAHAVFDFAWYLPALMALSTLLAACALRLYQLARGTAFDRAAARLVPRVQWAIAAIAFLSVGWWMVQSAVGPAAAAPHWDAYLKLSTRPALRDRDDANLRMIAHLQNVLHYTPGDARAQLRMAAVQLRQFDREQSERFDSDDPNVNRVGLHMIRDAAVGSRYDEVAKQTIARLDTGGDGLLSPAEIATDTRFQAALQHADLDGDGLLTPDETARGLLGEWLSRAVGSHYVRLYHVAAHCREALRQCPLQGQGYVYLAYVGFLDARAPADAPALFDQSLRVRPYDATVLDVAARELALRMNEQGAVQFWKKCFHRSARQKKAIVDLLAGNVGAAYFLEHIDPDTEGLMLLRDHFESMTTPKGLETVTRRIVPPDANAAARQAARRQALAHVEAQLALVDARIAEQSSREAREAPPQEATRLWLAAHRSYRRLHQPARARHCAQQAVAAGPDDYEARFTLGQFLLDSAEFHEAHDHLQWCLRRRPMDANLKASLRKTTEGKLQSPSQTARRHAAELQ